jgi:DNA ligase-1
LRERSAPRLADDAGSARWYPDRAPRGGAAEPAKCRSGRDGEVHLRPLPSPRALARQESAGRPPPARRLPARELRGPRGAGLTAPPTRLADLVECSRRVGSRPGRLEKIEELAACLRRVDAECLEVAVAYLAGELPQGSIGAGAAALRSALEAPAASSPSLRLAEVDLALERVARARGPGSAAERQRTLHELFARATRDEREFLARLILGELRQGAQEGLVVEAVARAAGVSAAQVRRALMLEGDLRPVARAALREGARGLERFQVELFRPLQPMLASPAEDVPEALGELGQAAFEWKLDGGRIQVHKGGEEVRVFTRRLNDVTARLPEVVEAVRALPARELILDGEALALRPDGRPEPFQVTMQRFGRKLDVEAMRAALPLRAFFFDCLRAEGQSLLDRPAAERFAALAECLPGELAIPRLVTGDAAAAEAFLREALERGHEGLVAKSLDAAYAAGSRGREWLKLKRAHTLDLVVLAAEWGHGRRRGWLSNLHLGARDPSRGGFVMLGKTFKGMTDEMLAWQTRRLLELEIARDEWTVHVRPELVVEVAVGGVQGSPQYPGGVALRFARVKRYRPDKRPEDADTLAAVAALREAPGEGAR